MAEIELKYEGPSGKLAEIIQVTSAFDDLVAEEFYQAADIAGEIGLQSIGFFTPVITGRLLYSEQSTIVETAEGVFVEFSSSVDYAPIVEDGSKYFSGRHMFAKGINQVEPKLIEEFEKAARRIAERMEG